MKFHWIRFLEVNLSKHVLHLCVSAVNTTQNPEVRKENACRKSSRTYSGATKIIRRLPSPLQCMSDLSHALIFHLHILNQ